MNPGRRAFLTATAKGTAAVVLSGSLSMAQTESSGVMKRTALIETLRTVGKTVETVVCPDGTTLLLLPYGGRVLGLYTAHSEENFYWTHPALSSVDSARAFYESKEWHNSGGDRTWISPEIDVFLPNFPSADGYFQPRELDPGNYEIVRENGNLQLVNQLALRLSRSGRQVGLRMTKSVAPAANPLRYEKGIDLDDVRYAGYTQFTALELIGERAAEQPAIGLWNLVQMPHGGELLIPTYSRSVPTNWFGEISGEDLVVTDHLVRYRMRAEGEHKLGVRAVATTGRVGYLYGNGDACALIIRNFVVNPSGEYVDVPWKSPDDLGYSTQACNVNSKLGRFSELEYHIPAIGKTTGRTRCDDAAQVWAYRGPETAVRAAARALLSPGV